MTDIDRRNSDFVDTNRPPHQPATVTGRDVVTALGSSPLAEVEFDRLTIKSKVRYIIL
jgi:hypothetical protein